LLTYLCSLEFLSVSRISTGGPKKTSPPTASGIFIHDTKLQYKFNCGWPPPTFTMQFGCI
ncbi:hypothetical protein V1525DRAFT_348867, partial [Lipomyces kononenkoae]